MAEEGLFSDDLLSPEVQAALPDGYKLRALRRTDYETGFLDCLRVLTTVGEISKQQFEDRYSWISRQDGGYFILVIEDTNASPPRVVGTGALLVERKLYAFPFSLFLPSIFSPPYHIPATWLTHLSPKQHP